MTLHASFTRRPITHRGLHDVSAGRPENSIEAFRAAIASNYAIELDLQLSKDGAAMVFHDYDLGRLTSAVGAVAQRTAHELGCTILTGGLEPIPTLAQALDLVGGRVPVLIEIKDQDGAMGTNVGTLETATVRALEGYSGPVAIMSFNPNSVAEMARLAPHLTRGLVTAAFGHSAWAPLPPAVCDHLRDIPDYDRVGASFISHEAADLGRDRVAEIKANGATILCWTVQSAAIEREARKVAHNITFEGYLA